jgi:hypothetical protein
MHHHRNRFSRFRCFSDNNEAIVDLPMRLLVSLIIATISISAIFAFMFQYSLFPPEMIISVSPVIVSINETNHTPEFSVLITNPEGQGIAHAQVIFKTDECIRMEMTNEHGKAFLSMNLSCHNDIDESFIDVMIKHPRYLPFNQEKMIKIIHLPKK